MILTRDSPHWFAPGKSVELDDHHWLVEKGIWLYQPLGGKNGILLGTERVASVNSALYVPGSIQPGAGDVVGSFASGNYVSYLGVAPALPMSMLAWAYPTNATSIKVLISVSGNLSSLTNIEAYLRLGDSGTPKVQASAYSGSNTTSAASNSAYDANEWCFAAARFDSTTSRSAAKNDDTWVTATGARTYTVGRVAIGARYVSGAYTSLPMVGNIAHALILPYAMSQRDKDRLYYEQRDESPYLLLRPWKRRTYVDVAVGGGATNTDSAAGSGAITVTGNAANALRAHLATASSGSVTVTGSAANGVHTTLTNVTSAADAGSIALTGSAANAVRTSLTAAESGAISITGTAANGIYTPVGAYNADAQSGSISVTGSAALGRHDYLAAAGSGSITVTGSAASAVKSLGAVADSGSIAITGSNALAIRTWLTSADAGSITLTGASANGVKATPGTGTLDPATIAAIADAVWAHSSAVQIEQRLLICSRILRNKLVTDPVTGVMTIYDDDSVTPYLTAQLYEDTVESQVYRGTGSQVRERLA